MVDAWLEDLGDDPLATLAAWLEEARARGLHEPEAAALATATPDGRPAARMVLVRGIQERELRFYTNHESRKADEIAENPRAASSSTGRRRSTARRASRDPSRG